MDIIVWNMKQFYEGRECLGPMLGSGRLEGSRRHWLKTESRGEEGRGGTSKLNSFSLHNFASCHLRVVFCLNVFNKAVTKLIFSSAHAHSLTSMGPACLKETNIIVVLFTLSSVIVHLLVSCQGHTLNCIARSLLSSWDAVAECWIPKCGLEVFHMDSYSLIWMSGSQWFQDTKKMEELLGGRSLDARVTSYQRSIWVYLLCTVWTANKMPWDG